MGERRRVREQNPEVSVTCDLNKVKMQGATIIRFTDYITIIQVRILGQAGLHLRPYWCCSKPSKRTLLEGQLEGTSERLANSSAALLLIFCSLLSVNVTQQRKKLPPFWKSNREGWPSQSKNCFSGSSMSPWKFLFDDCLLPTCAILFPLSGNLSTTKWQPPGPEQNIPSEKAQDGCSIIKLSKTYHRANHRQFGETSRNSPCSFSWWKFAELSVLCQCLTNQSYSIKNLSNWPWTRSVLHICYLSQSMLIWLKNNNYTSSSFHLGFCIKT